MRRHPCAGSVQFELADGNAGAVRSKIAKPENAATVGDANEADILFRPVPQDLLHFAAPCYRKIHSARLPVDMTEFEAGLADCRVVDDREEAGGIGHHSPVKQRLVMIEQIDEVDVSVEISRLVTELHHDPA